MVASVLLALGLFNIATNAASISPSMKIRFNPELAATVFRISDQKILDVFTNMTLGYVELKNGVLLQDVVASIVPSKVEFKDYDWQLNFDETEYIGIEGKDLKF